MTLGEVLVGALVALVMFWLLGFIVPVWLAALISIVVFVALVTGEVGSGIFDGRRR